MLTSPAQTQHIPAERLGVCLIGITSDVFEKVSYTAIHVTKRGDALLPVPFTVFFTAFFHVEGYIQHHGRGVPIPGEVRIGKLPNSIQNVVGVSILRKRMNFGNNLGVGV